MVLLMVLMLAPILTLTSTLKGARAQEAERVPNLCSLRHKAVDEALFENFSAQTGIAINRAVKFTSGIEGWARQNLYR